MPMPDPHSPAADAAAAHDKGRLFTLSWRRDEGAPSFEEMRDYQSREEALFAEVMERARLETTEPFEQFLAMQQLANPGADETLLRRAAGRDVEQLLRCEESLDEDGNPRWISLSLPDRRDSDTRIDPEGVLPSDAESAAPPTTEYDKKQSGGTGKGLLGRLFKRSGNKTPEEDDPVSVNPYRRLREKRQAEETPLPPHKRFLFRMLRMALLFIIIYEVYRILLRWNVLPGLR